MYPAEPNGLSLGNELTDVYRTFFAGDADQRNRCLFAFCSPLQRWIFTISCQNKIIFIIKNFYDHLIKLKIINFCSSKVSVCLIGKENVSRHR